MFPKKRKPSFGAWEIFRVLSRKGPLLLQALALIPLYKREPSIIYFMGSKSLRILVQNTFTYKGERQSNKDKETLQQIMFRFIV